ncbi:MAG: hypothetical protein DRJ66_02295 [Thermoprotei archaeon]|nr:MAG: hypothetical protein DRJ66_02295 [Thermoprotei archaeon]RLF20264.1 MAG: hypothetical protein DRZ82_02885 [Thermoprotei archaeon]
MSGNVDKWLAAFRGQGPGPLFSTSRDIELILKLLIELNNRVKELENEVKRLTKEIKKLTIKLEERGDVQ